MIVLDMEMSGTSPTKHSILSIGAVDFLNPENVYYKECRIWEGAHLMKEALEVNGFSEQDCMDLNKITEAEVVRDFFEWALSAEEHTIAGYNTAFDNWFLIAAAERAHTNFPLARRTLDLHTACYFHAIRRGIMPPTENGHSGLTSNAVSVYVGIPKEPRPHNALNGAKQAAECFSRLMHERTLIKDFSEYSIPWLSARV